MEVLVSVVLILQCVNLGLVCFLLGRTRPTGKARSFRFFEPEGEILTPEETEKKMKIKPKEEEEEEEEWKSSKL